MTISTPGALRETQEYRDALNLNDRLSEQALPPEGAPVKDVFSFMQALVVGATKSGHCFGNSRLVCRYMWWEEKPNFKKIQGWIDTLVEWGEITVEPIAFSRYGPWDYYKVIVIQNKRRFHRWRPRPTFTATQRVEVYARDEGACRHCGATTNLSIDHIVPWSKGGAHELDNFQTLCRSCNSRKGVN